MKLSYLLTAFAGAFVGIGFCVAIFLFVLKPSDTTLNYEELNKSSTTQDYNTHTLKKPESQAQAAAYVAGSSTSDVTTLADTLAFEDDFDQTVALYALLARAEEADILTMIRQAQSITPLSQRDAVLSIIFSKYAAINPPRALENAERLEDGLNSRLRRAVFIEWSKNDLDSALEAAEKLPRMHRHVVGFAMLISSDDLEPRLRMKIATRFNLEDDLTRLDLQEWLRERSDDPRSAWMETFRNGAQTVEKEERRIGIAKAWIAKEGVGVLAEIIRTLPHREERNSVIRNLRHVLVNTDPKAALELISELPPDRETRKLRHDFFRYWGESDPTSAFEALQSMGSQDQRSLFDRFLYNWARRDPHDLLEKSDKMPRELKLKAQGNAIRALARSSPHEAIARLYEQPELMQRNDVVQAVARNWATNDPRSALEWYLNVDMEDSTSRRSGLRTLTMRLTERDPDLALNLAIQTPGKSGSTMISGVFNALAYADAEGALQYVPRLKTDEHRKIAMQNIGYESAFKDIRESIELSGQLDKSLRDPFIDAVVDYALRSNRARSTMIEFFDTIPNRELKKRAALELLSENERWGFLSNAERKKFYSVLDREQRNMFDERAKTSHENVRVGPSRTR